MREPNKILITLGLLILCLGMISVWIAPVFHWTDLPAIGFAEVNPDQFEFEDDFFAMSIVDVTIAEQVFSNSRTTSLDCQPASLLPVFSPPKPS